MWKTSHRLRGSCRDLIANAFRAIALGAVLAAASVAAGAQEPVAEPLATPDAYHELETKYLFGFTSGSDIGAEGEKSVEFENTSAFQKRHGTYRTIEQEFEFESVPSQFFAYELSAHVTNHSIAGVDGLNNLDRTQFSGLSTDLSYLIIGRGPGSPIGLTLSVQPEWARVDGTSGVRSRDFSTEFRLIADTEVIPNRLYAAINALYQPDIAKPSGDIASSRTATAGISGGLAYRVAPKVTLGGEVEYYRAYEGLALRTFDGHALFVGPTLYIQFTGKTLLSLAFSTQVSGHAAGESHSLDLTNFERHHAKAKLEFEF
jgi:opacity protein-like surface antigen